MSAYCCFNPSVVPPGAQDNLGYWHFQPVPNMFDDPFTPPPQAVYSLPPTFTFGPGFVARCVSVPGGVAVWVPMTVPRFNVVEDTASLPVTPDTSTGGWSTLSEAVSAPESSCSDTALVTEASTAAEVSSASSPRPAPVDDPMCPVCLSGVLGRRFKQCHACKGVVCADCTDTDSSMTAQEVLARHSLKARCPECRTVYRHSRPMPAGIPPMPRRACPRFENQTALDNGGYNYRREAMKQHCEQMVAMEFHRQKMPRPAGLYSQAEQPSGGSFAKSSLTLKRKEPPPPSNGCFYDAACCLPLMCMNGAQSATKAVTGCVYDVACCLPKMCYNKTKKVVTNKITSFAPSLKPVRDGLFWDGPLSYFREHETGQVYLATPTNGQVAFEDGERVVHPSYSFTPVDHNESTLKGRPPPTPIKELPPYMVALSTYEPVDPDDPEEQTKSRVVGVAWRANSYTLGTAGHVVDSAPGGLCMFREYGGESVPLLDVTIRRPPATGHSCQGTGYDQAFIEFKDRAEADRVFARLHVRNAPKICKGAANGYVRVYGATETGFIQARGRILPQSEVMKAMGIVPYDVSTDFGCSGSPVESVGGALELMGMHICGVRGNIRNLGVSPAAMRAFQSYGKEITTADFDEIVDSETGRPTPVVGGARSLKTVFASAWDIYTDSSDTYSFDSTPEEREYYREEFLDELQRDISGAHHGPPGEGDVGGEHQAAWQRVDRLQAKFDAKQDRLAPGGGRRQYGGHDYPDAVEPEARRGRKPSFSFQPPPRSAGPPPVSKAPPQPPVPKAPPRCVTQRLQHGETQLEEEVGYLRRTIEGQEDELHRLREQAEDTLPHLSKQVLRVLPDIAKMQQRQKQQQQQQQQHASASAGGTPAVHPAEELITAEARTQPSASSSGSSSSQSSTWIGQNPRTFTQDEVTAMCQEAARKAVAEMAEALKQDLAPRPSKYDLPLQKELPPTIDSTVQETNQVEESSPGKGLTASCLALVKASKGKGRGSAVRHDRAVASALGAAAVDTHVAPTSGNPLVRSEALPRKRPVLHMPQPRPANLDTILEEPPLPPPDEVPFRLGPSGRGPYGSLMDESCLSQETQDRHQRHAQLAQLHKLKQSGFVCPDYVVNESAIAPSVCAKDPVEAAAANKVARMQAHLGGSALLPKEKRFWKNHKDDVPPAPLPDKPTDYSSKPSNEDAKRILKSVLSGGVESAKALLEAACSSPEHFITLPAYTAKIGPMIARSGISRLPPGLGESYTGASDQKVFTMVGTYKCYGARNNRPRMVDGVACGEDTGFSSVWQDRLKQHGFGDLVDYVIPKSCKENIHASLKAQAARLERAEPFMTSRSRHAFDIATQDYHEHTPPLFEELSGETHNIPKGWERVIDNLQHKSAGWNTRYKRLDKKAWAANKDKLIAGELRCCVAIRKILRAAAGARMATMSGMEMRALFLVDPKEAFLKAESHGPKKAKSKRWRIIWNASLIDSMCQSLVSMNACKRDIRDFQAKGVRTLHGLGTGHDPHGVSHLVEKVRAGAGQNVIKASDATGYDMSVPRLGILLDAERKSMTVSSPHEEVHLAAALLLYCDAFANTAHILNFFGEIWEVDQYGMTASGVPCTGSQNSFFRGFALLDAGALWALSVGDDEAHTGDVNEDILAFWGTVTKKGSHTEGTADDFSILSHRYIYENGRARAEYLNIEKMLATNLLMVSRQERIPACAVAAQLSVLRDTPDAIQRYKAAGNEFGGEFWDPNVDPATFCGVEDDVDDVLVVAESMDGADVEMIDVVDIAD